MDSPRPLPGILRIAVELRIKVYKLLFTGMDLVLVTEDMNERCTECYVYHDIVKRVGFNPEKEKRHEYLLQRHITSTCKQIYREAMPLFRASMPTLIDTATAYQGSTFHCPENRYFAWSHQLTSIRDHIQTLRVRHLDWTFANYKIFPNLKKITVHLQSKSISQPIEKDEREVVRVSLAGALRAEIDKAWTRFDWVDFLTDLDSRGVDMFYTATAWYWEEEVICDMTTQACVNDDNVSTTVTKRRRRGQERADGWIAVGEPSYLGKD